MRAAALITAAFWLELALLVPAGAPHRGAAAALLAVAAGGLALGRRAPLPGLLAVFGAVAALTALAPVYQAELLLPFAAPCVASFWLGAHAGRRALVAGLVLGTALGTLVARHETGFTAALFTLAVTLFAPALIGRLLRSRAALNRALREKAALLERRREGAAGRAVSDERTRIAAELDDVVAHALSAMTVQATGARRLALTRPAQARDAFGAIEATGREALDELRRLLGVLRGGEATLAPQPSLRHARSLVRRTTASGLPVTLRIEGERELPAGLDLTAYRVLQDALAAALERGGAGRAEVTIRYGASTLEIEVRDDGPSSAPRPLIGVRERAAVHGGRLTAGPQRSGGHLVRATLPLDGHPMPAAEEAPEPECAAQRLRPRGAWRRHSDVLAASVLAVLGVIEVLLSPDRAGPVVANVALALAYTLPLAWRRRAPLAVAAAVIAATLAMALVLTPVEQLFVPFVAVLAAAYACGAHRDGRAAFAGLALVAGGAAAIVATMDGAGVADFLFPALIAGVAWLAGRAVRAHTRLTVELHEAAAQLAEAGEDERRLAAVDERRRIARELHDLVAHSISVMVVQAGGARRILDRDPGRALEAASRIERAGREALGEMRHVLGMLNEPVPALAPQPTLAQVDSLVARARTSGLPTVLELRGAARPLPPGLDLAAYRIVQEALTNTLKHAPGAPTAVRVEWAEQTLALEVRNEGPPAAATGGGHGLVGMRERAHLYGGELEAGPADGGGWRVRATLPA